MNDLFRRFAHKISILVGMPWSFLAAIAIIVVWAITGPLFGFSDTWQLVINTGTTIVTFLMVFLIQNTQNRDAQALHLKLDELLRAMKGARTGMVDLEAMPDEELQKLQAEFRRLGEINPVLLGDDIADIDNELQSRQSRGEGASMQPRASATAPPPSP
jgi:low affinity Fe/Cu permease